MYLNTIQHTGKKINEKNYVFNSSGVDILRIRTNLFVLEQKEKGAEMKTQKLTATVTVPYSDPPVHPLNPLTPSERALAVSVVKKSSQWRNSKTSFDRIQLLAPSKRFVLAWQTGQSFTRQAYVTTYIVSLDTYYEYSINLGTTVSNSSFTCSVVPKARPPWTLTENASVTMLAVKNAAYKKALTRRGVTQQQFTNWAVEPNVLTDGRLDGAAANVGMPNLEGPPKPRSSYGTTLLLDGPLTDTTPLANWYVYPVPDVFFWTDSITGAVTIYDGNKTSPMPSESGLMNINTAPNPYYNAYRGTTKPIFMSQPDGPGYIIGSGGNNNSVSWQRWRFNYDVNEITGLVLNLIQYNDKKSETDQDNWRSIMYQLNIQEAVTAYGSEEYGERNFNFLDFCEYPVKTFMTPISPNTHGIPPYAQFLSPSFSDENGDNFSWNNAVAIYEVPDGMLWTHYEYWTNTMQGRTHTKLAMSFCTCIGNYDYLITYYFGLDGTIELVVQPSGFDEMAAGTQDTETSTLIHRNIVSANHQHLFGVRTDWNIDDQPNRVYESNAVAIPSASNAAWTVEETLFNTSGDSARNADPLKSRKWSVVNAQTTDSLGHNPGYEISVNTPMIRLANDQSRISKRGLQFLNNSMYATKYREDQQFFMGKYPVEKGVCEGVVNQDNDNIVDTDIVTWNTIGFSHKPDPTNFPVLNGERLSITFSPDGFFTQNPAIDVDPVAVIGPSFSEAQRVEARKENNNENIRRKKKLDLLDQIGCKKVNGIYTMINL